MLFRKSNALVYNYKVPPKPQVKIVISQTITMASLAGNFSGYLIVSKIFKKKANCNTLNFAIF